MTPKQYLSQLKHLNNSIQTRLQVITELRANLFNSNNEMKVDKIQSNSTYDFTKIIDKICDMENEVNDVIDELVDLRNTIISQIDGLDNQLYSLILINRYVLNKNLKEISKEFTYNYEYIRKVHGWALEDFKSRYSETFIQK